MYGHHWSRHTQLSYQSEVSTFPIVVIFFRGYVSEVVVLSYAVCWHIYIYPGKAGFCVFNYCAVLWCAQIMEFIMTWWLYTFICTLHYLIIIIMQTYLKVLSCWNACQIYSVTSMCLRWGKFSQLYFLQYMGLCVFSLPISLMVIVRIPVLDLIIIIKSEVWLWPICHCLG